MTDRRWVSGWAIAVVAAVAMLALGAGSAAASVIEVEVTTLVIDGDPNDDAITVSTDGSTLTIIDTGTGGATDNDTECSQVNAQTVTCLVTSPGLPPVERFEVLLDNGTDSFVNQNFVTDSGHVHSQVVGTGEIATGAKTIVGGPGTQSLDGGLDADSIDGGDGDDFLEDGGGRDPDVPTGGSDVLTGGAGEDATDYFRSNATPVSVTADGIANDGQAGENDNVVVEDVSTGAGNDVIVGDDSANILEGGAGDDQISGLGGNDQLFGEFLDNRGVVARGIVATAGNDTLNGGAGRDDFDCGRGFDLALRDPTDVVAPNCDRIGAEVVGDSAVISGKKKNKLAIQVSCPETEGAPCSGKLKLSVGDKKIGKGTFVANAGQTKKGQSKLTKKGVKAVKRAGGSLLITAVATTTEPGGVSQDGETILIHR